MGKDPAVLFYTADFLTGTQFFTDEQCGQYIRLLCQQHQLGHIPENHMLTILKIKDSPVWKKFVQDEKTLWFNERMDIEKQKRANYVENRRKIGILGGRPQENNHKVTHKVNHKVNHKGNLIENDNDIDNNNINVNREGSAEGGGEKEPYCLSFESLWPQYPSKGRIGKKLSYRHYQASVKTPNDEAAIKQALQNYIRCKRVQKNFIQNAATWFNNWRDWIDYKEFANENNNQTSNPPPQVEEFFSYFSLKFKEMFGFIYPCNYKKDSEIAKDLLKLYKMPTLIDLIDVAFDWAKEGGWLKDKLDISIFKLKLPQILIKYRTEYEPTEKE